MFPRGGEAAAAERSDPGSMGGQGDAAAADGYEYDVKRQRLLHSGAAAASYYVNQNQNQNPYFSSSSAALQSSIAASLSSYFAGGPSPPSSQHPLSHGGGGAAASGMFSSYHHPPPPSSTTAPSSNSNHLNSTGMNPNHLRSTGPNPNHMSSAGLTPNYLSGAGLNPNHLSSTCVNPNFLSNTGRITSHLDSTSPSSSALIASYPPAGSSASLSSSLSPFRARSPPPPSGLPPVSHHLSASPPLPTFPLPLERRSPHIPRSPPLMPPPFSRGPGFSPFSALSRAFPVVRLRGLPFNCTESDVYDFFRGLDVVDVLLTHRQGRFSGEAYCVFGVPMQVEFALHRNKQNMGQRYIEVFRSKKHEYYLAVAAEVTEQEKPGPGEVAPPVPPLKSTTDKECLEHTGVLKLRGLPFSASKRDVVEFFKDFDLKDKNIHFVVHSDGRATGEAYVEFDGPSQSKQAMSRDKMMLGSRYVELFPSSSDEAAKATGRHKK